MSTGAYIARSGWEETPIKIEEWLTAVSTHQQLKLRPASGEAPSCASLRRSLHRHLDWHAGCIHARRVNRKLALVMFSLAAELGARVFSERRNPYRDIADWERRTRRRSRRRFEDSSEGLNAHELTFLILMGSMILIGLITAVLMD